MSGRQQVGNFLRELIYLSRRKLDNFVENRSIVSAFQRIKRFEVSALESAAFAVESHPSPPGESRLSQIKKLEKVIKKINPSSLEDPGLSAGRWVEFDVSMSHAVLYSKYMKGVIFLSSKKDESCWKAPQILLHGSSGHYFGENPKGLSFDSEIEDGYFLDGPTTGTSGGGYVTMLANNVKHVIDAIEGSHDFTEVPPRVSGAGEGFEQGVRKLLAALSKNFNPLLAVRMSGLARLTCDPIPMAPELGGGRKFPSSLIIGTPLYVEYNHQY